ncbi:MAG TPA: O-antigen ligase family protein [Acidobacteriaceae bacterium]|jgi:O-antigen ligase
MTTLALPIATQEASAEEHPLLFSGVVGFFFIFRICLNFLFFQSDLVVGAAVSFAIDLALLFCTVLYSTDVRAHTPARLFQIVPLRWIAAYLALSLASVFWTGAQSALAAAAYWASMAVDVLIVLLLLRQEDAVRQAEGILKGVVVGAAGVSLIAWCSPTTADLRLGNDLFLHPNSLGLFIGIATLIAQYLASQSSTWKWLGIALAITFLRALSKTAIAAFLVAELWYLMQNTQMSRKTKARIVAAALLVIACFWGLLRAYITAYNTTGSGNQVETLTGRTVLWTIAISMSLEKPWLGHGIYSFKSLVPPLGIFQPVHAHNELLQQLFEYGVVGVVVAVGIYWSFFRQARRSQTTGLSALCLTLLIFSLVRGLADTINFGLSFPFWLMAGLSISLARSQPTEAHAL